MHLSFAGGKLFPLQNHGVKCMSMGFLMKVPYSICASGNATLPGRLPVYDRPVRPLPFVLMRTLSCAYRLVSPCPEVVGYALPCASVKDSES